MVLQASRRFPLDLQGSWVIGDHEGDIRLAGRARLGGAVFLTTGHGRRELKKLKKTGIRVPVAHSIAQAVNIILRQARAL